MNKEFSFKNYFLYAFRYWIVIAVCSIVGLAAGLTYGILSNRSDGVTYRGQILIGGISNFMGDVENNDENQATVYDTIKRVTLNALCNEEVGNELYDELSAEWKALSELSSTDAQNAFFKALNVQQGEYQVYVSFTQQKDEKSFSDFSKKVVDSYIAKAIEKASEIEPAIIQGEDRIIAYPARLRLLDASAVSMGIIKGSVLGTAAGFVLSLIVMFVIYFIDRRITSYEDIAQVTGKRLLAATSGDAEQEVCPQIDCEMNGHKILLVCGSENTAVRVSRLYTSYAVEAGHKSLLIDFAKNAAEDTLGDFIKGKKLSDCVSDENGASVLYGEKSWRLMLKSSAQTDELKKEYGRIVLCAPYYSDGSLGIFSKISDKVVFALDQSSAKLKDVAFTVQELQAGDKAVGAVIEKTGRSFVGGKTYFETAEEEC